MIAEGLSPEDATKRSWCADVHGLFTNNMSLREPTIQRLAASAFDKNQQPGLAPGAMCSMMAKQQYLSDDDRNWRPHVMFSFRAMAGKAGEPIYLARRS